jgi:outer membrane immunogenic protein
LGRCPDIAPVRPDFGPNTRLPRRFVKQLEVRMNRPILSTSTSSLRIVSAIIAGGLSIAALFTAAPAVAADLGGGLKGYPAPVEPRLDLERWTGFYLGAALSGNAARTGIDGDFGADRILGRGWDASILAGYNWQAGRIVYGLETDIGTGKLKGQRSNGLETYTADFDALGSIRARAGYLVTSSFMVYATGGFAYAHSKIGIDGLAGDTSKQWFTGWQGGLGTELKLDPRWSLRLEYLYTDFGAKTITGPVSGLTNTFDPTMHTLRAGLTFKF